ncbi:MAG: hypothetical protein OZ921_15730 [Sorangiineae bacterium]|nr:hypothetical protein [Polyangiaceae bacterium]MEB2323962.1 hypothetical protein [Sorangiineae bacterium]
MAVAPLAAARRARSLLAFAATAALVGIGWSVSGGQAAGAWITVLALALLIYALHRYGRTGADDAH